MFSVYFLERKNMKRSYIKIQIQHNILRKLFSMRELGDKRTIKLEFCLMNLYDPVLFLFSTYLWKIRIGIHLKRFLISQLNKLE